MHCADVLFFFLFFPLALHLYFNLGSIINNFYSSQYILHQYRIHRYSTALSHTHKWVLLSNILNTVQQQIQYYTTPQIQSENYNPL